MTPRKVQVKLRRVCEDDSEFLWQLANDRNVRGASFSTASISWGDHVAWLESKLKDSSCEFVIATDNQNLPIGQVRFDITGTDATISISMCEEYRGKGYGTMVLQLSVKRLFESSGVNRIHAFVKATNKASVKAFARAGFEEKGLSTIHGSQAIHFIKGRESTK